MLVGRLFHARATVTRNDRSPMVMMQRDSKWRICACAYLKQLIKVYLLMFIKHNGDQCCNVCTDVFLTPQNDQGCEFGNFPPKFPSENFRKFVLIFPEICCIIFFHFIIFNYHHRKKCLKIRMFLANNSPDLCFLTLCIKIRQNNLYLASLPRISANLNENQRRYIFQALANISGNFRKY